MSSRDTITSSFSSQKRTGKANVFNSPKERIIAFLLATCAFISVFTTLAIIVILISESVVFFSQIPVLDFFTDLQWTPQFTQQHFGIWPLLTGTMMVTVISACVALPIGLASAIFIAVYAPRRVRRWLKPALELLAGVPTVVYGYFALTFVTPNLQNIIPGLEVYNALSAGLVVGIMIIPMVASLSEDAIISVPRILWQGGYALGATRQEVVSRVVVPAALSGIVSSFILALSRAIGETMIVTLAAGATPKLTLDPTTSIQTMTAYIVQVSLGDTPQGTVVYQSLFAVGLLLFLLTLGMNVLARFVIRRFSEHA